MIVILLYSILVQPVFWPVLNRFILVMDGSPKKRDTGNNCSRFSFLHKDALYLTQPTVSKHWDQLQKSFSIPHLLLIPTDLWRNGCHALSDTSAQNCDWQWTHNYHFWKTGSPGDKMYVTVIQHNLCYNLL